MLRTALLVPLAALVLACGDGSVATVSAGGSSTGSGSSDSSEGSGPATSAPTTGSAGSSTGSADSSTTTAATTGAPTDPTGITSASGTTTGIKLDVGFDTDTTGAPPVDLCHVQDDMNAGGDCETKAPPDSFTPDVQWAFVGEGAEKHAIATPLVANMTDDNGDGEIDLCDIPDVIVPLYGAGPDQSDGHIYILDGLTGAVHLKISELVDGYANPAVGDIDGDGLPEIVTIRSEIGNIINGHVIALEHDGALKWESGAVFDAWQVAVSLADLDNDGDVEIMAGRVVLDHLGNLLFSMPQLNGAIDIPVAADLDGDGDLEVLRGGAAYHHDGTVYYT
ncbi:MAG TPA: VCBS repeat-containing protein, partial [Nannocystis sp.]